MKERGAKSLSPYCFHHCCHCNLVATTTKGRRKGGKDGKNKKRGRGGVMVARAWSSTVPLP